ncbi:MULTISPECIES: helix-turn-helix domain-containing protein [Actinoalloteichus]|uniref:DNA binding protein with helix-turn-helix domain n=1 Tax=Actinoalloteichus fjordicus TaxID=1612552 RepID=A0AAC9LEI8_9PSEU|nr:MULTISPECIES: helix-turn-helix domain-containing protein [Actinoalloteichus]APU16201.1 DNA binding protein with helix-turn-helix domain [Actinoalloteichus fjordicus]APU22263.1 DNA binding protein with helix-turn-helix domain [Actinoalloteichus sp. GBA129-24]
MTAVEEAKALSHPLRLRILRLALDTPKTNRELAESLDVSPGTTLHHVRLLTEHGFLESTGVRRGTRGSREVPYLSTGKSWVLDFSDGDAHLPSPMTAASYAEYQEAPAADRFGEARLALRLTEPDLAEMRLRIAALVDEFRTRRAGPEGAPYALSWAVHRRSDSGPPTP